MHFVHEVSSKIKTWIYFICCTTKYSLESKIRVSKENLHWRLRTEILVSIPSWKNWEPWFSWNIGNCYRVWCNLWFVLFYFFGLRRNLLWIGFEDCSVKLKLRWRLVRYCLRFLFSLDLGFSIWDSP